MNIKRAGRLWRRILVDTDQMTESDSKGIPSLEQVSTGKVDHFLNRIIRVGNVAK